MTKVGQALPPANPPPTHTPPQRAPPLVGQTPWSARDPLVALLHLLPTPPPTHPSPHRAATVRERCLPTTSNSTPAPPSVSSKAPPSPKTLPAPAPNSACPPWPSWTAVASTALRASTWPRARPACARTSARKSPAPTASRILY